MTTVPSSGVDTDQVAPHERLSFWREAIADTHEVVLPEGCDPNRFSASALGWHLGNALIIGLPCVTASPADVRQLMDRVERQPDARLRVDLQAGTCEIEGFRCAVSIPAAARDALVSGAWDTTGLLLERYGEVDAVAARLPYISGF